MHTGRSKLKIMHLVQFTLAIAVICAVSRWQWQVGLFLLSFVPFLLYCILRDLFSVVVRVALLLPSIAFAWLGLTGPIYGVLVGALKGDFIVWGWFIAVPFWLLMSFGERWKVFGEEYLGFWGDVFS